MTLRSKYIATCDGGCGTTAEMDGSTNQPLRTLVEAGWVFSTEDDEEKTYCPTCRGRRCPDGGKCHHSCAGEDCFRVRYCGPLSGRWKDDRWPKRVRDRVAAAPQTSNLMDRLIVGAVEVAD